MEKRHYFYGTSVLILVVVLALTLTPTGSCEDCDAQIIEKASPEKWLEMSSQEGVVILDIRTPEEYNENHIEGAINIDYYSADYSNELDRLDKTKTYLMYCRSGNRGRSSLEIMKDLGFMTVYDLDGGINSLN